MNTNAAIAASWYSIDAVSVGLRDAGRGGAACAWVTGLTVVGVIVWLQSYAARRMVPTDVSLEWADGIQTLKSKTRKNGVALQCEKTALYGCVFEFKSLREGTRFRN
jgi:hypothetical protein